MATVVYGGSPRHTSSRSVVSQSQTSSLHRQHTSPYHHHSNIIIPPSSYLSSSSVTTSSYVGSSGQAPSPIVYHSLRLSDLHGQHHRSDRHNKRKSAVEMLAESKPFYVKSEIVLDRHQHLSNRSSTSSGSCKCNLTEFPLKLLLTPHNNSVFFCCCRRYITVTHSAASTSAHKSSHRLFRFRPVAE